MNKIYYYEAGEHNFAYEDRTSDEFLKALEQEAKEDLAKDSDAINEFLLVLKENKDE